MIILCLHHTESKTIYHNVKNTIQVEKNQLAWLNNKLFFNKYSREIIFILSLV